MDLAVVNRIAGRIVRSVRALFMISIAVTGASAQSYTWQNAKIVGGGFVDGIVAHPGQNGLFYARTDVGGAYRYNSSTSTWVPLLDWTTAANWYEIGVDSIAIDPNNTNQLYMAVGEYAAETYDGDGAILISSNQGASFYTSSLPFRVGSNDNGRNGGERLQVDQNLGSVLFYGTYALQRSLEVHRWRIRLEPGHQLPRHRSDQRRRDHLRGLR